MIPEEWYTNSSTVNLPIESVLEIIFTLVPNDPDMKKIISP